MEKKKDEVARNVEAEIRANEQVIREDEYKKLSAKWTAEAEKVKSKAEAEVADIREKAESELEKAHTLRVEAESERLSRIHSADQKIQQKYAQLTEEYKAKIDELNTAITEYNEKRKEFELDKADLDEEREYIDMLKERYNSCNIFTELFDLVQFGNGETHGNYMQKYTLENIEQYYAQYENFVRAIYSHLIEGANNG